MNTPEEAANYLISLADEYLVTPGVESTPDDYLKVQQAASLLMEKVDEPGTEILQESLKELMKLIENGVGHYNSLYERFNVQLRLSTDPKDQSRLAVALSETAGAVAALGSILAHVLSDQASLPTKIEDIFTGQGLTYPKVLKQGKKIYLPRN